MNSSSILRSIFGATAYAELTSLGAVWNWLSPRSRGATVTQRIAAVKQPTGGYLRVRDMIATRWQDAEALPSDLENTSSVIVGLGVDYLSRFLMGAPAYEAFAISLLGARVVGSSAAAQRMLDRVTGLDDQSILAACRLAGYDSAYRAGRQAFRPVGQINPNTATRGHIREMVNRTLGFFSDNGPVTLSGFGLDGGYTAAVGVGDGDYVTTDTLWDCKVSKNPPTSKNTLQLLMYWQMGLRSIHPQFRSITRLGIWNPRLGMAWIAETSTIPEDVVSAVCEYVIGY